MQRPERNLFSVSFSIGAPYELVLSRCRLAHERSTPCLLIRNLVAGEGDVKAPVKSGPGTTRRDGAK